MGINIGEVNHEKVGSITLEISNDKEFIKRVKEINRQIGRNEEPMRLWKIRVVGEERVPAEIQRMIGASKGESVDVPDDVPESPIKNKSTDAFEHLENQGAMAEPSIDKFGALGARTDVPEGEAKAPVTESEKPKRRVVHRNRKES